MPLALKFCGKELKPATIAGVLRHLQCACSKDKHHGSLLPTTHLQIPHEKDRKNRESPVRDTSDRRVAVESCDDDLRVHARAFGVWVANALPEVR